MRRSVLIGSALVVLGLVVALVLGVAGNARRVLNAPTLPETPVATLKPRHTACQAIELTSGTSFSRVVVLLSTTAGAGVPPVGVTVRPADGAQALASGRSTDWRPYPSLTTVRLDRTVPDGRTVRVCLRNGGARPIGVYGSSSYRFPGPTATTGSGQDLGARFTLGLDRASGTRLDQLPRIADRAVLWRAPWLHPWFAWVVFALAALAAPAALVVALVRAARP